MAKLDLSDEQVDQMWAEMLENYNPDQGKATKAWDDLRDKYRTLGHRRSG